MLTGSIASLTISRAIIFAALMTLLSLPFSASAAVLRIAGTGNALGTMRLMGEAFTKEHPETTVIVLDSIGTSGAIRAVPKGAIEIGLSSRLPKDEEAQNGMTTVEYARSPTVFAVSSAVSSANAVASITRAQVADIYSGKLTAWPDGTKIRPVMRQPGDDNTRQIARLSPAIEQALAAAETRTGLTYASTDQEAADKVQHISGSIGVTTVALIRSENRSLRPLALDGIEPSLENLSSGRYPMVKHFYFVLPKEPTPATKQFLQFIRSPQGRRILEENGHLVP